jgi:hypothetical protein
LPYNRDVKSFGKIPLLRRGMKTLLKTLRGTNDVDDRLAFFTVTALRPRSGARITSPGSVIFSA